MTGFCWVLILQALNTEIIQVAESGNIWVILDKLNRFTVNHHLSQFFFQGVFTDMGLT